MVTSIVLAGGKGRRLGRDKAMVVLAGQFLLQRAVNFMTPLGPVLVVTAAGRALDLPQGVQKVEDVYPEKGPLGGIYSGLRAATTSYALAVGCDMPFLNQDLLRYLVAQTPGYDLVIPRLGGLAEPLHAAYSKEDCLPVMERLIRENRLSLHGLLPLLRVRYVEAAEIDALDPRHLSFFNINTSQDLDRAHRLLVERGEVLAR